MNQFIEVTKLLQKFTSTLYKVTKGKERKGTSFKCLTMVALEHDLGTL